MNERYRQVIASNDAMTVRAALAPAAQREVHYRMLPTGSLLDPASGEPAFGLGVDVVLGCLCLTTERPGVQGQNRRFGSWADAIRAHDLRTTLPDAAIDLQARIWVRMYRDLELNSWEYDPATDRIDPSEGRQPPLD